MQAWLRCGDAYRGRRRARQLPCSRVTGQVVHRHSDPGTGLRELKGEFLDELSRTRHPRVEKGRTEVRPYLEQKKFLVYVCTLQ